MMRVAGQRQDGLAAALDDYPLFEKSEIGIAASTLKAVAVFLMDFIGPTRRARAENDVRTLKMRIVVGNFFKKLDLRQIDVGRELNVDAPKPPTVRQLHCEIAASLLCVPPTDPALMTEQPQKTCQSVIPIVVAWQSVERRCVPFIERARQRRGVGTFKVIPVLFP